MLATGIKTPVGIKIAGPDLQVLAALAERAASAVRAIPGTISAYPERTYGGYDLDLDIDREAAARYGLTVGAVQDVIRTAIGGVNVTQTVATALEAVRLGASHYLSKPASIEQILSAFHTKGVPKDSLLNRPFRTPTLPELEHEHIERVMLECEGNVTRAAQVLGPHRRSLQRKLLKPLRKKPAAS